MAGPIKRYRMRLMVLGCLVWVMSLAGCGGSGGGGGGEGPPGPPPSPPITPRTNTVVVTGTAHAGTPARPLTAASCRFVDREDGQTVATASTSILGRYELTIPVERQGFLRCQPDALPRLGLSAFLSTVGQAEGTHLPNEDVTPASSVIADVIRANMLANPQARKEELLAELAREEADITALVEAATLAYQTLLIAEASSAADFAGDGEDGDEDGGDDGGGADGEAGDGGEFSPLPGALCTFSLDAAGLVRADTIMADLYANGQIDRVDILEAATPFNAAIDAEGRRAITQAFANLFPIGIGPSIATIADGTDSPTPGRYFLPIPAGVPGVVTCTPADLDQLVLNTCVRARAPNEVLSNEDVTPVTTVVCELANEAEQSGTTIDRNTTRQDLLDRLSPLRIFLSEDRNGNGIQDPDEIDKNGDGEFVTIVELETDEPLTEDDRDLALLASMSTTIFDTMRIERDALSVDQSFAFARDDFFTDGLFETPLEPIAPGVESALDDPANQAVLGTDDVVTAATTGTLQGRVTDVQGRPIPDVQVVVSQGDEDVATPGNPAITDVDGRFRIGNIPVGDTTVKAFLGDFEVLRVTTNVVAVVTINLEIAPTPQIDAQPDALVFGGVSVASRRVLTVALMNRGLADLTLNRLLIEGAGATAFRFTRRPVLPVVVAAGSEVTVDIEYEPTVVSSALANLRVESDAVNTPLLEVPLIGEGVTEPVPQIQLSRTSFVFGEVELEAFREQSMVVSNSGTAPLTIRAITIEAASGSGFILQQVPALPAILPPDGELPLQVRFQPGRVGVSRGIVRILSDADDRPSRTVALNGTGVDRPVPEISANPSRLAFGEAQINIAGEEEVLVTETVTLINTGTADLTLTRLRVDSSRGDEFRLFRAPALPITIIPGAGLALGVQYRPTVIGSVTGAVRIRSDAVNIGDLTISLSGTGVDTRVPKISVSRSTLNYQDVEVNVSRRQSVDVTNTGTGDLVITEFRLQSPAPGVFEMFRPPETPFTLVPGATQRLRVQFEPNVVGYATGVLRIFNNDVERPRRRISLQGEGVPVPIPQMVVTPEVASFGDVQVGSSRRIVVTIANPGRADLEVTTLQGSALSTGVFTLRRAPQFPVTIRPDAEVSFEVVFRPNEVGSVTGTLRIRGTAPDTPVVTLPLHGTATPEPLPRMRVRPRTVDFGQVQEGTSQTEIVTIENNGTADLILSDLLITSRSSRDFTIDRAPQLPVTVIPGSTAQVRIRYSPSRPGVASGALRLRGNDPDIPSFTVSLNGTGTPEPAPEISLSPGGLSFGELQEGRERRQTLTVSNPGTDTLRLTRLVISGSDFRFANTYNVPIRIPPQGAVRLDVIYAPSAPGSDTGTVRIENNTAETPVAIVSLSGYATPEPRPRIDVDPGSLAFADVQTGSQRRLPIRIFNIGEAPLDLTALRVDGGPSGAFSLADNPAPVTIVAGGSVRVYVVFAPVREGSVTGTFFAESNADNTDGIEVPLSGTGLPEPVPQIDVPGIVEFPEVQIGASRTRTVTIGNTGEAALVITAFDIDGGDNNEFQVRTAPSLPVVVLPGGQIEVRVTYQPIAEGSANGTLTVESNDPETPSAVVPLSGVGAPRPTPQVDADTQTLAFSEVEVGRSRRLRVTFTNVGNATLTIQGVDIESEPEGVFLLADLLTTAGALTEVITLAPQASLPIDVIFAPRAAGAVTGTLALISDAVNESELTVPLEGMGTEAPTPALGVSPTMVEFGPLAIGQTRTLTVSMRNDGTADLTISMLELTAADGTSFQLGDVPNLPAVVPPDTAVTAEIQFIPENEGSATGTFRIVSDDPDDPETVVSVTAEALPEPVALISVIPSQASFGEVPVGDRGTQTLRITNEGNDELSVMSLTVTGSPENVFRLGGGRSAPFTVAPGESETVDVFFEPQAAGLVTATLEILSNASNAPEEIVSLRGTGTAPQLTLRPAAVEFGGVPVGSNRTLSITAENPGIAPLVISAITIEGADFALGAGAVATTLQPGDSLTFDVVYQPTRAGERSGVVRVSNNTAENPEAEVPLSGTGTVPDLDVSPSPVVFDDVFLQQRTELPVTFTNVGEADLEISSVTVEGGAFSLSSGPIGATTLSPGASLTVDVTFAPLNAGETNGSLRVVSNDPNSPTTVALMGNGLPIPVLIDVATDALAFDPLFLGETGEMTLTIVNPGASVLRVTNVEVTDGADVGFALDAPFSGTMEVLPGDEIDLLVTFTPVALGEASGTIEITSNADSGAVVVDLSGSGVAVPTSDIAVMPQSWDFGSAELGSEQSVDITIENTGNALLTVTNIEIVEGADSGFVLQDAFGGDLLIEPGDTVTVTVLYTPVALGTAEGRLEIASDAGNVDVDLNGAGIAPVIEVTPGTLEFGSVFVNERRELELTIANIGDAPLSVSSIEVTDGADNGFALETPFDGPVEVVAGSDITVTVGFTPSETGEVNGAVEISSNANDDSLVRVELSGNGTEAPTRQINASPEQIDFDTVPIDDTRTETLTIRNDGNTALAVSEIALTSGGEAGFAIVDGPSESFEIVPGGSFVFEVSFTPQDEGEVEGNIRISSNADNDATLDVPLLGFGAPVPMPLIEVDPNDNVTFGNVELEQSRARTVTITNTGNEDLNLSDVFISEGGDVGFSIDGGALEDEVLEPGESLELTLRFSPVDEGQVTGVFRVESDADNEPVVELSLGGTGTAIPMPVIEVTPREIRFGNVGLNDEAEDEIRIENTGDADLTVDEVRISEGGESGFSVRDVPSDGVVLEPGESLTVRAVFGPLAPGVVTGTVSVLSDGSNGGDQMVSLQGTGVGEPEISVSPTSIDFGDLTLGETATDSVRIENIGTETLQLESVTINGNSAFTLETEIGDGTLEPGEALTLELSFQPTELGDAAATLDIVSNAADPSVSLTGNAIAAAAAQINVTPRSWDFGNAELGSEQSVDITIENNGNAPLTVTGIEIVEGGDLGFALQDAFGSDLVIEPGDRVIVTALYTPSTLGASEGRLQILSDAGNVNVDINGVGIAPLIEVTPEALAFGNVFLNENRDLELTIANIGDAPLSVSNVQVTDGADVGFALETPFNGPVDVAPGSNITMTVGFTPSESGEVNGAVEITSNADNDRLVRVELSGNGAEVPTAQIAVTLEEIDFGEQAVNDTQTQELRLRNEGDAPLIVSEIALTSGGEAGFAIVDGPSESFEIVPGGSFVFEVSFTPQDEGEVEGNIRISSNADNDATLDVPLLGFGAPVPMPLIEVDPNDNVTFGNVELEQSRARTVTITNTGNEDLNLRDVFISEGGDVGFSIDGGALEDEVLEPGESLELTLRFSPVDEGQVTGVFRVESDADNEPVVELSLGGTGTAIPMPVIEVTPREIRFGNVNLNDEAEVEIRIENTGDADLTVDEVRVSEGGESGFSVRDVPSDGVVLEPGESLTVRAVFGPLAPGVVTGTVSVLSDGSNGGEQMVSLQGTGVGEPEISVSPTSIDFGDLTLGETDTADVSIENIGTETLNVDALTIRGDEADFDVAADSTGPFTIEPGDIVVVTVIFDPSQVGEADATLEINSNAGNNPNAEVDLSGNANEPPIPEIELRPSDIDFGNAEVGDTQRLDLTIRNVGTGPLDVESARIVAGGDDGFGVDTDNQLPVTIESGAEVNITVTFTPEMEGDFEGTLQVTSNDDTNPQAEASLRGTGEPVPVAQIRPTPDALAFEDTERGDTETLELVLANDGNRVLRVSDIVIDADPQAGFSFPDGPFGEVEIVAGGEFMLTVAFSPTEVGDFRGTVQVTSDSDTDSVLDIPLRGRGVEVPMPRIVVSPSPVEIGDVTVGERRTQEVVIENDGNATLDVESIALTSGADAGFSIDDGPSGSFSLEPGETQTITVAFEPDEPGAVTGTIEVISNAVNEETLTLSLNAVGLAAPEPAIGALPDRFDFRNVEVGQQERDELVIENTGAAPLTVAAIGIIEGEAAGFLAENVPNLPVDIDSGETITLDVVFAPTGEGAVTGTLAIESNDPNTQQLTIPLQGNGTVPLVARIQVDPTELDFQGVRVGQQRTLELVVSNPGTDDLQIIALALADGSEFSLENAPNGEITIAPNGGLTLNVVFSPDADGEVTDELVISSNADGEPETRVGLRGEGVTPLIEVEPLSLIFETLETGQSQTLSVDIFNIGTDDLDLTSISVDDPSFILGEVPESIAPGDMATMDVTFMPGPDREGDIVGELRIDNNSANEPQVTVSLTAVATIPLGPGVFVAQTALTFGDTTVAETVSLSLTIQSVGLTDVMLLGLNLGNGNEFALSDIPGLPTTLAPGESMMVDIGFTPATIGVFTDQLRIESDDENDPVINISINGMGIEAVVIEGVESR